MSKNTKNTSLTFTNVTAASEVFANFTELSAGDQTIFVEMARELMREDGVTRSREMLEKEERQIEVGDRVIITSGDHRFMGTAGVVTEAKRIRLLVQPDLHDKSVYLFRSDVQHQNVVESQDETEDMGDGDSVVNTESEDDDVIPEGMNILDIDEDSDDEDSDDEELTGT